jgi:cystathionine gamma-synthase
MAHSSIDTVLAGLGGYADPVSGSLVPPVGLGVTYRLEPGSPATGYARSGPPGGTLFEKLICALDGGAAALGFSSGISAAQAVLAALPLGCHVIVEANGYYEFRAMVTRAAAARNIAVDMVDLCEPEAVALLLQPGRTALIWAELPTNPQWHVPDLAVLADLAHRTGAALLVDATAATPIHCRPLEHGADIVLHSATKYLNGHGDLTAGALVLRDDARLRQLQALRTDFGTVLNPSSEWLLLRGMRTLAIRMERASASALAVAQWLKGRPEVCAVHYPGLKDHAQFEVASRQFERGFGAMVSFLLASKIQADRFVGKTTIFRQATSIGSTESLIEHRAMTEGDGTRCPDELVRLSIGLESVSDLIADLEMALVGIAHI